MKKHHNNITETVLLLGALIVTAGCSPNQAAPLSASESVTQSIRTTGSGSSTTQIVSEIDPSWRIGKEIANGATFYEIDTVSPDGKHVAYCVSTSDYRGFIVRDNIPGKTYNDTIDLTFSPDSPANPET
jgi:hypothetical protein